MMKKILLAICFLFLMGASVSASFLDGNQYVRITSKNGAETWYDKDSFTVLAKDGGNEVVAFDIITGGPHKDSFIRSRYNMYYDRQKQDTYYLLTRWQLLDDKGNVKISIPVGYAGMPWESAGEENLPSPEQLVAF